MKTAKDLDGGTLSDEATKALLKFYQYWGNYLDAVPAFLAFLYQPMGMLAKAMYSITNSLERVFNNLFKLFGLFGYLGDQNTLVGQIYHYLQLLGVGIFTVLLIARVLTSLLGVRLKYKEVLTHFMLVTLVVAVLPQAVTKVSTVLAQDMQRVQSMDANGNNSQYSSLALQPIKNNVVDLKVLIDNDFDTKKFPMDDHGYINPVQKGSSAVNSINDKKGERLSPNFVTQLNFSAALGTTDVESLEKLDEKTKGYKGLFLHKVNGMQDGISAISEHRALKGLSAFESVYPRYKVNWVGMYAQFIVLMVLLTMMSIKVVKSIFETVLTSIIAPIQGYSSVESSKKFKELLMTIVGAIAGIFFEIIIMRVSLEVMRDLPSISLSGVSGLTGNFFDGLNMWETCISSIIVYFGIFFGAMQGVSIIERWLGVSTGHSDTAQQMMGGILMANALSAGTRGTGQMLAGVGSTALNVATSAPGVAARVAGSGAKGIAAAGGGLSAAADSVKQQGLINTAKAGMANVADKAGNKLTDQVGGLTNKAGEAMDGAMDGGYKSTKEMLNDGDTSRLPEQTAESLKEDIAGGEGPEGTRNEGLQYGSREELGLVNPPDIEPVSIPESGSRSNDPDLPSGGISPESNTRDYGLNSDSLHESSSGGIAPTRQSSNNGISANTSTVPAGVKQAKERLNSDPANQKNRGIQPGKNSGDVRGVNERKTSIAQTDNGSSGPGGAAPSANQSGKGTNQTAKGVKNTSSKEHYQKAEQNFKQASSTLQFGAQKMNMGSSRSHIRGAESNDDE